MQDQNTIASSHKVTVDMETAVSVRDALFGDGTTSIGSILAGKKLRKAGVDYAGYRLMEFLRMVELHGVIHIAPDPDAPTITPQYLITPAEAAPETTPASMPARPAEAQATPNRPAEASPSLERYMDAGTAFADWVLTPSTSIARLLPRIGAATEPADFLNDAWAKALDDHAVTVTDDGESAVFTAQTDGRAPGGATTLRLTVKRSRPDSRLPFYLSRVDAANGAGATAARDTLRTFAFLGGANPESPDSYQAKIDGLAAMALPENWEMPGQQHAHALLATYITYTFHHLHKEGKIVFNKDVPSGFAAVNTGLVDRGSYEPIYMVFDHNVWTYGNPQMPKWHLQGFCVLGNGQLGKQMSRNLPARNGRPELPRRASYFRNLSDVLLDIQDRDMLRVDYSHIIGDNIGRLPKSFLEREIHPDSPARQRFGELPEDPQDPAWKAFGHAVLEDAHTFRALRMRLELAIEQTLVRVGLDYKVAIPSYYPTTDSMQFLLPVCLNDHMDADVALVVQSQSNGTAQAHTILTLPMAFVNARTICKPDSSWLSI
ncbi:DUF3825 domain-containing protein [Bifidobacterium platyrrhinorum]|uniref:DUF3825 domain-containing protein n=1 Tax=Bifidobacterium platyrrhinorum TaxID=2661628 RepID=A0A6L9SV91_9BIFI|nr:DUF3825 domain-containing protein [Bifidobacterium platyrrhinorum]NEG55071.1 DUF3825 domain-containing protein [Bifidobacterium platyrrhinorum]